MLLLAAVAGAAQPVAANPFTDSVDDEDDSLLPSVDAIVAGAQGLADRVSDVVDRSEPMAADEAGQQAADELNANNATFEDYLNNRTTATTGYDVIEVTFEIGDTTDTRYIVSDVENETYTNVQMVNSTDRTVDETITLREEAAENADKEIDFFANNYASEQRGVDDTYIAHLSSRYGSIFGDDLIETSFEV